MVAIQFYRPYKNTTEHSSKNDFLHVEHAPPKIVNIFKKSCYDCHSDNTSYAWYDNIAPLSWYVDSHIKRAKFSLNLSEWGTFEPWRKRLFIQGGMIYDINMDKMPPQSYLFLHSDATISKKEKILLNAWFKTL